MKYTAVIFDLDGTLIDSLEDLADSANKALTKYGFNVHPYESYKLFIGNGIRQLIKNSAPKNTEENIVDDILKDFRIIYNANYVKKTCPYNNVISLLENLKTLDIKMAICSNKADKLTKEIVQKVIGEGYFDVVYGEREGIPRKPDPASLLEAAGYMGVKPENTIYLGDSGGDMISAKNAGMFAAGALWGFRDRDELLKGGAQIILSDPMDLFGFIKE